MANVSRLDQELADALGLAQAVRAATQRARIGADDDKVAKRLSRIDSELDDLQEQVNEHVVADAGKRSQLTGRSRRTRDAETDGTGGDALDALQDVVSASAHLLAQWIVVDRLAKAAGDKDARRLAKFAIPLVEEHVEQALRACRRYAKRLAKADAAAATA